MTRTRPSRAPIRALAIASGVGLLVGITACSAEPVAEPSPPAPTPTPLLTQPAAPVTAPAPEPTAEPPPPPPNTSPLSGLPKGRNRPVVAVKIDNTVSAQPHTGVAFADVVYVQEVEGGYTRLLALYSTTLPEVVGPVRSARISDVDLLAPFGKIPFAYSGAQTRLLRVLDDAPFTNRPATMGGSAWSRQTWRPVSWVNATVNIKAISRSTKKVTVADTGWQFDAAPPSGGRPGPEVSMSWGGSTARFVYDADAGVYRVWLNGQQALDTEREGQQRASTVIVQSVKQTGSGYGDRYGGKTPLIHSVGEGRAWVFRDGKRYNVRWSRPTAQDPTSYTMPDGTPMVLKPGQQWILLLPKDTQPDFG